MFEGYRTILEILACFIHFFARGLGRFRISYQPTSTSTPGFNGASPAEQICAV